jgi:hypothetical protein
LSSKTKKISISASARPGLVTRPLGNVVGLSITPLTLYDPRWESSHLWSAARIRQPVVSSGGAFRK